MLKVEFRDLEMMDQGIPAEGRGAGQQSQAEEQACKQHPDEDMCPCFVWSCRLQGLFFLDDVQNFIGETPCVYLTINNEGRSSDDIILQAGPDIGFNLL